MLPTASSLARGRDKVASDSCCTACRSFSRAMHSKADLHSIVPVAKQLEKVQEELDDVNIQGDGCLWW